MSAPAQYHPTRFQTYGERSAATGLSPLATYLLRLMHYKQTNLCVSADVTSTTELLHLAEEVGDCICVLKTHADIIDDFSDRTIRGLVEVSRRKKFVIFEDRKFLDIGSTLQLQYTRGPLSIVKWASIVNAALFPGPAVIPALAEAARKAIVAYNTSVSVDISASPAGSVVDSGHEDASVDGYDDDDDDDEEEDDDDDEGEDEDEDEHGATLSQQSANRGNDPAGRKQSVVSVSTTISTKTETISPPPTFPPSLSRGSTKEEDEDDSSAEETKAQLAELGPPPFFRALLLLAQMSSEGNHFTPEYTQQCLLHARQHKDFVMGFIAQQSLNRAEGDNFITMTPGVQLSSGSGPLGQQYNTPRKVIVEGGSDVIIVGRGIIATEERRKTAMEYQRQGWQAYQERLRAGRRSR